VTKREMAAQLQALRSERDELIEVVFDACALLIQLATTYPHEPGGACPHCAFIDRALEIGRPLNCYEGEVRAMTAAFKRDNPRRYAEMRRGIMQGATDD
jgi:hypothetical protein